MRKTLLGLLAIFFSLLILLVVLVFRMDFESLGAVAMSEIQRQSGVSLTAGSVEFDPWKGLSLDGVTASARYPAGDLVASIDQLQVQHRLWPLLRGEVVLHEVILRNPSIDWVSQPSDPRRRRRARQERLQARRNRAHLDGAEGPASPRGEPGQDSLYLALDSLEIEGGAIRARSVDRDEPDLQVEDVRLSLADLVFDSRVEDHLEAVSGRGSYSTGAIRHGVLTAEGARGRIALAPGVVDLVDVQVQFTNADMTIRELEAEVANDPPRYSFAAVGELDLNGLFAVEQQTSFGTVRLSFAGAGKGPELGAMEGSGRLLLTEGSLPGFPAMVQIENILGRAILSGRRYDDCAIDFDLVDSELILAPFEMTGSGGAIGGSGRVDLGGGLDLRLFVSVPRDTVAREILEAEGIGPAAEETGSIRIPFRIVGSVEEPGVDVEWEGLRELLGGTGRSWAERLMEEAAERAEEWLREQAETREDPQ